MIRAWQGIKPKIHASAYIHETAEIIGKVTIGKNVSIWPHCVLRGDIEEIVIGENSNIQDHSVIHTDSGFPTVIKRGVTVGHGVILHGCRVEDNCIIGMGSILLNGVHIEEECIIGAGAVVSPGTMIVSGSLALGVPAKVIRKLKKSEHEHIRHNAIDYLRLQESHRDRRGKSFEIIE